MPFWKVLAGERLLCVITAPTEKEEAQTVAERMFPQLPITVEPDDLTKKEHIHAFPVSE